MMEPTKVILTVLVCIMAYSNCWSQRYILPLSHDYTFLYDKQLNNLSNEFHTSSKPYFQSNAIRTADSVIQSLTAIKPSPSSLLGRKIFSEHLFFSEGKDYNFFLDPVFNFSGGLLTDKDEAIYRNTRGFLAQGKVGKNLTFSTTFYENQARFPQYLDNRIRETRIVPGSLVPKPFKEDAYDYFFAEGFLSYTSRNNIFNVQFGQGKNFIGDGYRSVLLSDNAFSYPFLKVTTNVWRVQYTNLFTKMKDIRFLNQNGLFIDKYTSIHHLSARVNKRVYVGVFEAITYQDSLQTRGIDIEFLNPIIFYRPIESSLGSNSIANAMLGADLRVKMNNSSVFYGQFFLDEFNFSKLREEQGWWGNKFGYQLGVKIYDLVGANSLLQLEYNAIRPYTYTHITGLQNYGHYNQSLTHPSGANLRELVVRYNTHKKRFLFATQFNLMVQGQEIGSSNWGANIYLPYTTREQEFGNEIGQGDRTQTLFSETRLGYLVNPSMNSRIELTYLYRRSRGQSSDMELTSTISLGFTTNLLNMYTDF